MLAQPWAYAPFPAVGFLAFTIVWLVTTALWLWTLWDCLTAGRVAGREKTVWAILLLCTHIVGAVFYLALVRFVRPQQSGK